MTALTEAPSYNTILGLVRIKIFNSYFFANYQLIVNLVKKDSVLKDSSLAQSV